MQSVTELKELEKWKEKSSFWQIRITFARPISPSRDPCLGRDPYFGNCCARSIASSFLNICLKNVLKILGKTFWAIQRFQHF